MKKSGQRKISFVLFVVAVFFAGVVLAEFHSSLWMVLAAGVVLTAASCFFIWGRETKEQEQTASGKTSEILLADRMAEWARSNEKAEKSVGIAVKKQQEAMNEGMSALKEKLAEVIRTQENTMKTLILYNKENAKQIALSEREELGRLCRELQKTMQTGFDGMTSRLADTSGSAEDMQQIGKELLNKLEENFQKLPEFVETADRAPAAPVYAAAEEPMPDIVMEEEPVAVEQAIPEIAVEEEPVAEEVSAEVTADEEPEPTPAVPEMDLSDPNKAMSADDIAALFATLGATEEPAVEEAPAPEISVEEEPEAMEELLPEITAEEEPEPVAVELTPEPAPAVPEMDLSDPNKAMSADDIAALFATLGTTEEPAAAEEPEPVVMEAEPAPAIPEVDLSDPNKAMSPDDIAALFAAMGN